MPKLYQGSLGLGVYTGGDGLGGIFTSGDLELDNMGDDEAIAFDLLAMILPKSITLALASATDDYRIYGSNNAGVKGCTSCGLSCLTSISTLIASVVGSGLSFSLTKVDLCAGAAFRYLVATSPGGSGDGYKVKYLSEDSISAVPLAAGAVLMFTALDDLGLARKRKS